MDINNPQFKQYEEQRRAAIFTPLLSQLSYTEQVYTSSIINSNRTLGISVEEVQSIITILNNKLNELSRNFHDVGISLWAEQYQNPEDSKQTVMRPSFVGEAIITGIVQDASSALQPIFDYYQFLNKKLSFTFTILSFTFHSKFSPEDLSTLKDYIIQYNLNCNSLYNYTLKEKIVTYLVHFIKIKKIPVEDIPNLLTNSIFPVFKKLGFTDLIPQLENELHLNPPQTAQPSWILPSDQQKAHQYFQGQISTTYNSNSYSSNTLPNPDAPEHG